VDGSADPPTFSHHYDYDDGSATHGHDERQYRHPTSQRSIPAAGENRTLQTHPGLGVGQSSMATAWVKGRGERQRSYRSPLVTDAREPAAHPRCEQFVTLAI